MSLQIVGTNGPDTLVGGPNTEEIFGRDGDDVLRGGGGANAVNSFEFLVGEGGNDQLFGEDGTDALFGRVGNDTLDGGAGTDVIFGEEGSDRILGGAGQDALVGGAGADVFVLTFDPANPNLEGIFDFNRAEGDRIEFAPLAGSPVQSAAGAVGRQFTIQGMVLSGGQLIPTLYTGIDFGSPGAPQVLLVGGNPSLLAGDFNLVGGGTSPPTTPPPPGTGTGTAGNDRLVGPPATTRSWVAPATIPWRGWPVTTSSSARMATTCCSTVPAAISTIASSAAPPANFFPAAPATI